MEYLNEAKQIVGLDADMVKAMADAGGFKAELICAQWDSIFSGLQAGKYDAVISSVTVTEQRKASMDFSDAYLPAGQAILVKSDSPISGAKDLSHRTVGVAWPPAAEEIAKLQASVPLTRKAFESEAQAVNALASGEIDALLLDEPFALYHAQKDPHYKGTLRTAGSPVGSQVYAVAVRKGNSGVQGQINRALSKVRGAGIDLQIRKKWLE